jgi:hypothetical protein
MVSGTAWGAGAATHAAAAQNDQAVALASRNAARSNPPCRRRARRSGWLEEFASGVAIGHCCSEIGPTRPAMRSIRTNLIRAGVDRRIRGSARRSPQRSSTVTMSLQDDFKMLTKPERLNPEPKQRMYHFRLARSGASTSA